AADRGNARAGESGWSHWKAPGGAGRPPGRLRLHRPRCGRCAGRQVPSIAPAGLGHRSPDENNSAPIIQFSLASSQDYDRRMPALDRPVPGLAPAPARPAAVAVFGLLGLAAAIGIGRFAFTPRLPLMQAEGLSLAAGAWLASANYLGYFAGALAATIAPPALHRAIRGGLAAVAASTVAMALAGGFAPWMVLRFVAGVASAYVMVGISAWSLGMLAAA